MPSRYIPKPKTKMMPCKRCGGDILVGWKTRKSPQHFECAVKAAADNNIQLAQHSGPYYEAWRVAMSNAFAGKGTTRGPSPNNILRTPQ